MPQKNSKCVFYLPCVLGFLGCLEFCEVGAEGAGTDLGAGEDAGAGAAGLGFGDPEADVGEFRSNGLTPRPAECAAKENNKTVRNAKNLCIASF